MNFPVSQTDSKSNENIAVTPTTLQAGKVGPLIPESLTTSLAQWVSKPVPVSTHSSVAVELDVELTAGQTLIIEPLIANDDFPIKSGTPGAIEASINATIDKSESVVATAGATGISKVLPHTLQFDEADWGTAFKTIITVLTHNIHLLMFRANVNNASVAKLRIKVLGGKTL